MSAKIQTAIDALAAVINDELGAAEDKRLEAVAEASNAATETNKLHDSLTAQQAALAAAVAEVAALKQHGSSGSSGASAVIVVPAGAAAVRANVAGATYEAAGVVWPAAGPCFDVTADDVTIRGVRFSVPNPPPGAGRIGVKPAIRTTAKGTRVVGCTGDAIDQFVEAKPGAENLLIDGCTTTDNCRAGAVYCGGAKGITVTRSTFKAKNENTVRFSPENGAPCTAAVVSFSDIENTGGKAAVEFRHVIGAECVHNRRLKATANNSAIGVGDKQTGDGEPGAHRIYIADNDIFDSGSITLHAGASEVTVENNRFHWQAKWDNAAVTANGAQGTLKNLTVRDNTGESPVAQKPLVAYMSREKITGLVDVGNAWTVKP